jgi:hypothetical protein
MIEHIHRMSSVSPPVIGRQLGIPAQALAGDRLLVGVAHVGGRSFNMDPRQQGYTFSRGNHPNFAVTGYDRTPGLFCESIGAPPQAAPVVIETFKGKPGKPEDLVTRSIIPDSKVPSLANGLLADVSSMFGAERGLGNIVSCRGEEKDVVATQISEDADRRFIVINHDDWQTKNPERQKLIADLDQIHYVDIEKTELSPDCKSLILTSKILDEYGNPFVHPPIDVSCLGLDRIDMYRNPGDKKFSLKLVAPDRWLDHESTDQEREPVATFPTHAVVNTSHGQVRAFRDKDDKLNVEFTPNDGKPKVEFKCENLEKTPQISLRHRMLSAVSKFVTAIQQKLETKAQNSKIYKALQTLFTALTAIADFERWELILEPDYRRLPFSVRRAIIKAKIETLDLDNYVDTDEREIRPRYVLQFYDYRETRFEEVLDKPLEKGESVVITQAKASLEVVHLNRENGRPAGTKEIVPVPFELPLNIQLDPRPHGLFGTRFGDPVGTALAGQSLHDPYVTGTNIMAAIWPKVDQLGFFGLMMLTAMGYPYGVIFADPRNNPWFVRTFSTISHSIFDGKSDAGKIRRWLTGDPVTANFYESVGAAIVTGPNTHAANPVREGHLFYVRVPGRAPHQIKTAMPGWYILVIEDAQISYMDMTMFGLKTETTTEVLSAGGGLDHYQTCWTVQRGTRWNGGKCMFLMDGASEMWIDLTRGSPLYRELFGLFTNPASGLTEVSRADLYTTPHLDSLRLAQPDSIQQTALNVLDPGLPVTRKFKFKEAREVSNVGDWYWVCFQKIAFFLSVPALISLAVLPIPVFDSLFFFACLGLTIFAWPYWAIQMMKVGVNPKTIISLNPIHIIWGDLGMRTQFKSGLDIERLGVGKFRISDNKNKGNRLPAKDKRFSLWVGGIAPTLAGGLLTLTLPVIAFVVGIGPILLAATPFLIGNFTGRILSRLAKRLFPNPNSRSFLKSAIRWAAGSLPLTAGVIASLFYFQATAIIAIPLVAAIMAGGWSLFNGINILRAFKRYFSEQRNIHSIQEPNPQPGTIPKHKADTWRTLWRVARGKEEFAKFTTDEFTTNDLDPDALWRAVENAAPNLLAKPGGSSLDNLNSVIEGEGTRIIDAYQFFSSSYFFSMKVKRLAGKTAKVRAAQLAANRLEPEDYDRICELNRLVIEEITRKLSPRKNI